MTKKITDFTEIKTFEDAQAATGRRLPTEEDKVVRPETVRVAGLEWDTENLKFDDREYFNQPEAISLAARLGRRLPTKKEFEQLTDCPQRWDDDRKGMWFADEECDLGDAEKSLFLPAAGHRHYSSGLTYYQGSHAYYWSSSTYGTSHGYYLPFSSSYVDPSDYADYSYGFTVRCVR